MEVLGTVRQRTREIQDGADLSRQAVDLSRQAVDLSRQAVDLLRSALRGE